MCGRIPKISIIIPVYKVENYLERCVQSVLKQTYPNLEIILVDDGSPDNCGTICDNYANENSNVSVIHQKNQGLSAARNNGMKAANGDFFGFVDSDDIIEPDMYERLYKNIEKQMQIFLLEDLLIAMRMEKQMRIWKMQRRD